MKQLTRQGLQFLILWAATLVTPTASLGQDISPSAADSLRAEIAELRMQLDSIRALVERQNSSVSSSPYTAISPEVKSVDTEERIDPLTVLNKRNNAE